MHIQSNEFPIISVNGEACLNLANEVFKDRPKMSGRHEIAMIPNTKVFSDELIQMLTIDYPEYQWTSIKYLNDENQYTRSLFAEPKTKPKDKYNDN